MQLASGAGLMLLAHACSFTQRGAHVAGACTQELLSHCLELHKDSQQRIMDLDRRLRQYGLKVKYQGPIVEDLNEIVNAADAHANIACTEVPPKHVAPQRCSALHAPHLTVAA
jgi:hypothetical protein